jgi:hypothetical protein
MRRTSRSNHLFALAVALPLVLAACGRPAPFSPPGASPPRFQALVVGPPEAQGNHATLLYDSAGGRALATGVPGNASEPRFAGAGRIAYLLPGGVESARVEAGPSRTEAGDPMLLAGGHAWSSTATLAYLAYPSSSHPDRPSELVIRPAGGATTTISLPANAGPGQLWFSPDGRFLALADSIALEVRRLDGSLAFAPAASGGVRPSEATWGRAGTLYFWDARGVNASDVASGETRTVLPGLRWFNPDASPDGRHVVFETHDGQGLPRLHLLDTETGGLVSSFSLAGASHARFVSPTEIWYHDEAICGACAEPTAAASEILRYDLVRRTERTTGLAGFVADVRTLPAG